MIALGNLSFKNNASYAFDYGNHGNRLRATAKKSYRYDAQGRRVRQDVAAANCNTASTPKAVGWSGSAMKPPTSASPMPTRPAACWPRSAAR